MGNALSALKVDAIATSITFGVAGVWIFAVTTLSDLGILPVKYTRKVVHIGTGLVFLPCWTLFKTALGPFLAASVPFLFSIKFALIGLGILRDEKAVKSMSRTGDARELLYGPVQYGIIHTLATMLFWRSPVAVAVVCVLCAGDGFAEVFGRALGKNLPLPWNKSKSWPGSIAMLLFSFVTGSLYLAFFKSLGWYPSMSTPRLLMDLAAGSVAGTLVESVSPLDWDNVLIFVTTATVGGLLAAMP
eukprot:CAMPEP_0184331726 /NCGR_PEP_ID=MMETSP1089-20130417/1007_1 /TAXON_ID=38269 ORGANISM="Gloeochaete wittrockiana, Strain SAG46.84" /NCGR_SAMPLE_ID=MMETSP1089 /ASSEMBLY_ACC=CAM_ASM_000445 /LENGTH=244 /DNA_ID=CAMNT_0026654789 /DNA_START=60 /DNA_END=794 /DNA_ORIENTATION=-